MILSSEDKRRESCHDVLRMFMWIIFLIAIGLLIYFFVQSQKTRGQTPTENESHLDIIKKRYAKGEINKEDFDRMKRDLET